MSLKADKIFPPVPFVERGKHVVFGCHPKGGYVIYPNKNNVIIRDIVTNLDNDVYFGHSAEVQCAKYSPSGFYIASGDKSGKIQIWDTTQRTHILKNEFHVLSSVNDLAWSTDNTRIAVGGLGSEKFGKVINAEMGTEVGEIIGMSKAINAIDFKPTRPFRIAAGSEDFSVCFFEGPPFKFTKSSNDHKNFVNCCRFSPKGDIFVTGSSDGRLLAYDATSGDLIGEFGSPAHKFGVYGIDFSSTGNRLASVSGDKKVKLWDTTVGAYTSLSEFSFEEKLENMQLGCVWTANQLVTVALNGSMACFDAPPDCSCLNAPSKTIFGHSRPIKSVGYSTTSDRLITASYDCTMLSWDVEKGLAEPFSGTEGHSGSIQAITVFGDKVASVGVDDRLVFASVSGRSFEQSVKLTSQPRAIASSDDQLVLVICYKGVYLFSIASETTPLQLAYLDVPGDSTVGVISAAANLVAVAKSDGTILLYTNNEGKYLQPLPNLPDKTHGEPTTMSFSPDGAYLAVGDADRYVYVYKVNREIGGDGGGTNLLRLREWRSHAARVTCVAWTPNSEMLASGSLDCGLNVYRPEMSTKVCEFRAAHPANMITALVWKSNNVLFSTGQDAFVKSWIFQ